EARVHVRRRQPEPPGGPAGAVVPVARQRPHPRGVRVLRPDRAAGTGRVAEAVVASLPPARAAVEAGRRADPRGYPCGRMSRAQWCWRAAVVLALLAGTTSALCLAAPADAG